MESVTINRTPLVSVIVPAFNSEDYIERTIETVFAQTFTDLELIVVDDGSMDGTALIVQNLTRKYLGIRLIEQENRGIAAARNKGIVESRGELIAILDADDLWHPAKLQRQVEYLDLNHDVSVVNCYSAVVDVDGLHLGWRFGGVSKGNVYRQMLKQDLVAGGSVPLIRRRALQACGLFDEELSTRCDWDLWLRLSRKFSFGTVPQALVGYTRRPNSASHNYEDMLEVGVAVLQKVTERDPDFSESMRRFCQARDAFAIASMCFIDESTSEAWKYIQRSISVSPKPVLSSPRRVGVILLLTVSTALPRFLYRALFNNLARLTFNLKPGRPFQE